MDKAKIKETVLGGIIKNNPTFVLVLGTCPTIAMTTSLSQAFAMGVATTFVLIFSNLFISLLRGLIPDKVRIPCYIVIISTFVTIVRMVMQRFMPDLYGTMRAFIDLIVVNCIILARAESFASKNGVLASAADGLFMGIGFTLALTLMGAFREILGAGAIFGVKLWDFKIEFFSSSAGAFFTYGVFIALFGYVSYLLHNKRKIKTYKLSHALAAAKEAN